MKFINPRPAESAIVEAYQSADEAVLKFGAHYESTEPVEADYSWTGDHILRTLFRRKPGGVFLDVGAGRGWAVKQALQLKGDAYGYEIGRNRAFEKDPHLCGRIFRHPSDIRRVHPEGYDIVHMSAVLEHVYEPIDFLKKWSGHLKPDGLFCIAAVPNMESLFIFLGLDGWEGNLPPAHLHYFTPSTLRSALDRAGLEIVDFFTMGIPVAISFANPMKQHVFGSSSWYSNNARSASIRTSQNRSARAQQGTFRRSVVACLNHMIRMTGMGSNCYAICKKRH